MSSPLAHRTFRSLFLAQVIALIGTGLATIALALLAHDLAGADAGAVLGTALALKMCAYVGLSPLFGGLARRLPRRRLLVTLDLLRAGVAACLPLVTETWQVYLLIFVLNACSAGFTPTFQATIPDVLPDEADYTRALSLSRLAYDLENMLSPLLAAAALLVLHYDALFAANALAFLVSAGLVLRVSLPPAARHEPAGGDGVWCNILAGLRIYLATPRLRALLALSFAVAAGGAMVLVNTVVYVQAHLGGSQVDTAMALVAAGAGSMLVAVSLPRLLDRFPDRPFLLGGGVLLAIGLLAGAWLPSYPFLLLLWLVLGAASSLVQTPAGRLLKRSTDEADRPAVYATQFALSHAAWLLAYLLAGWMGVRFGLAAGFLVLSGLALAATIAAIVLWRGDDGPELVHRHAPMFHEHLHFHDDHHQHAHEGWEGPEPHRHPHRHQALHHRHRFVINFHHPRWPGSQARAWMGVEGSKSQR